MSTTLNQIVASLRVKTPEATALVEKAYRFSEETHKDQKRLSGESLIEHSAITALRLAEFGMDAETVSAGLLHDTIDDGGVEPKKIIYLFGEQIYFMVDGVSNLSKLKYRGEEEAEQAENLRKLFVSMAKDVRVLIIKLVCRLNNVETLEHLEPIKRRRIAVETLEIYARLADRLGMWALKEALEDGAFQYAHPEDFKKTKETIKVSKKDGEEKLEKLYRAIATALGENGIRAKVDYRIKSIYSTYKKLKEKDWDLEKIHDTVALRVIVDNLEDCYRALGIIHSHWTPFPTVHLKDYISTPKPNGYQSLHTVIFTGDGGRAEVQIRTQKMHDDAEFGIVSHVAYNEAGKPHEGAKMVGRKLQWMKQLLEWQKTTKSETSGEFMKSLKTDFFQDQIFVFTPKGDVIDLPKGATPIDFAYAIHSDVGDHTTGAKMDGKMVALDTELRSGNVVEIMVKKSAQPSERWLEFTQTTLAKKHIRQEVTRRSKNSK
ncbi:MAG: bifunctional (p)ppGpp synthetase/guanosine-3',5'-bis(diphosphate) 3'-pyrophosphohydrolase [Candidatus Vogelbacteria bacterium]|nr:bifunctional (p)ppGpp synthetase/guanosine-3',5'-bis(diphosphate) 3'-pyrophosphohydrolase [Candidatus Vogelbacteria bacterium]